MWRLAGVGVAGLGVTDINLGSFFVVPIASCLCPIPARILPRSCQFDCLECTPR